MAGLTKYFVCWRELRDGLSKPNYVAYGDQASMEALVRVFPTDIPHGAGMYFEDENGDPGGMAAKVLTSVDEVMTCRD